MFQWRVSILAMLMCVCGLTNAEDLRSKEGLLVIYDFGGNSKNIVQDRSGIKPLLDLKISNPNAVQKSNGSLVVKGKTKISSAKPAQKIIDAVSKSGQFSVEAWIKTSKIKQKGPARIVSISKDTSTRNFTLGQDNSSYDFRFRTDRSDKNGLPSVKTGNRVKTELTHIIYSRDKNGQVNVFINGKKDKQSQSKGKVKWDKGFHLLIGNEMTSDRPWIGTFYLIAVYSKVLKEDKVSRLFKNGPKADIAPPDPSVHSRHLFHTKVAAILSEHCLECHDTGTSKGDLDLSYKLAALKGGKEGPAIVPGKIHEGSLWESIKDDDMPKKRKPLTSNEKEILKEWINTGAAWPIDRIDPLLYGKTNHISQNWLRRLTVEEYIRTVRDTLKVDIRKEAEKLLPKDLRADGFSNTAYNLKVDLKHVNAFARLAEITVERMDLIEFAKSFGGQPKLKDMSSHIKSMGRWILRGPLDDKEEKLYRDIVSTVSISGGSVKEALAYVIQAMMQSPRFIYRIESQDGIDSYEIASRLSYAIWGSRPDKSLLDAAEKGQLLKPVQIEVQVKRMISDSRAVSWSTRFVYEWLDLDRLKSLKPDKKHFPSWDPILADDMKRETIEFFKEVIWNQKKPVSELLNSQVTFLTPRLARHYGLTPQGNSFQKYDLSKTPSRGGLLTHGSLLTVGGDEASMVTRGLFVMHDLLRGKVNDPPPTANTTPVPTKQGLSQRSISLDRIADKNCGGCHGKFEPLAFGLEKFDGLGSFKEMDSHGNKLRDDGKMLIPGEKDPIVYKSSAEMMDKLAASQRIKQTITSKLVQFAIGRPLNAKDAFELQRIHKAIRETDDTYQDIMAKILSSNLILQKRMEAE